jgi:hypothetical protein
MTTRTDKKGRRHRHRYDRTYVSYFGWFCKCGKVKLMDDAMRLKKKIEAKDE